MVLGHVNILQYTLPQRVTPSLHHFRVSLSDPNFISEGRANDTKTKMKAETRAKIEETVREILEKSDMSQTTEFQIRKQASEKMGLELSQSEYKAFVRHVVNTFLEEQEQKSREEQDEEEEAKNDNVEYDDEGNPIICKLSDKRRVTIQDFRGRTLVSIREYYRKDGKELPSAKGIALTEEQWAALKKNIPAIEKAVKKMQSQTM